MSSNNVVGDRTSDGAGPEQPQSPQQAPARTQEQSASQPRDEPSLSLPKAGGAVRGMGEKFTANPVTGTASVSVPIALTEGRGGFGPKLELSYDSGGAHHRPGGRHRYGEGLPLAAGGGLRRPRQHRELHVQAGGRYRRRRHRPG